MTCGSIYKIVFPNGKHYIGLTTTSLEQRTKEHKSAAKYGDTKCIYKAIRKYGLVDTLELIEIDTADTIEELCEKEIGYIIEYNSYYMNENGYNMTYGGEGTNGYVFTEEDRQKSSEAKKKYFEDNPDAGKEHGERMKKHYKDNPDAIQKCSEAQKKRFENPEAREQMSEIKKKYFEHNPDAIKKNSEAQKKYYEDHLEAGKEHGEKMKKHYEDHPEAREQMSEIKKKHFEDNPEMIKKILDKRGENKPFDVFAIDGTFIKTFTYQFEAKEYLQTEYKITSTLKISEVLSGTRNSSAGFVFKYK
jgi:hypothetical protein